ncbi:MAG: glycerate kinase [Alphaproteobacteria bacterium]|nr:glycerate kinase [Alphaproteobacteria bacterium]
MTEDPKPFLRKLFDVAVDAAQPSLRVPGFLPSPPKGRTIVAGAGKAGAAMVQAVEANWDGPLEGLVITRYGHGLPTQQVEVVEASHPVPDAAGFEAAQRVGELVRGLSEDDLVLFLISGGGSALMTAPAEGISLADKQAVNKALLACGAHIGEINCVRKHLSAIKGGRLVANAFPARRVALMISDVPGDEPSVIASGPTVVDPSTREEALGVIAKYKLDIPSAITDYLSSEISETPKPGDPRLASVENHVIAAPSQSLAAATAEAEKAGLKIIDLGDLVEGEARDVGREHGRMAMEIAAGEHAPTLIISGGECTVTIAGQGKGGPNTEYLMGMALELDGAAGIHVLACDTDGIDGAMDNAGAMIDPTTLARARASGLDTAAMLADNDAHAYFLALGDLVVTGPSHTNVNDFRAVLIT